MSGINAGELDREITLITGVKTQDSGSGAEVITWDADAGNTVWAQWLPAGSREVWQAQSRLEATAAGGFKIYAISPAPTPDGTRILYQDRLYDLQGVTEIGRGEGYELIVVARAEGNG